MLKIFFNLTPDVIYKRSRLTKVLSEKSFKFVQNNRDSTIVFNLNFILLLAKVDPITKR